MENNRTRYIVVGGVLWVAFLVLVFGMMFLNESDPRIKKAEYQAWFPQVGLLGKGDPVAVNGVKVGKVVDIELKGRRVLATISIDQDIKIPTDSRFRVQNIGMLGERQIGILMGAADTYIKPGEALEGGFDAGISEAMGLAGEVMDSVKTMLVDVREILDSTVGRKDFQQSFHRIVANAERLENRLDTLIDETKPGVRRTLNGLQKAVGKLNGMLDENRQPIRDLLAAGQNAANATSGVLVKADSLAQRLSVLTARLESKDNTLGALLHDGQLYTDLTTTLDAADSLLRIIIQDGLDVNVDIF